MAGVGAPFRQLFLLFWIDFNPQKGREMKDMNPMLVLSPNNFNLRTGLVIGLHSYRSL
ncbi:MAG: type II toxin-antitoxin system PemK/MazF family toxin [Candidatus Protochlamydia sp.]|nr:type II toxin-antitoxin system PemK/MazF family toxin [Candidatus Protochlamydia sp.]